MYRSYRKEIPALSAILIFIGLFLYKEPEAIPWAFGLGITCLLFDMSAYREPEAEREENMISHAKNAVKDYGAVLEQSIAPGGFVHSEKTLPHSKNEIRQCIEFLMLAERDDEQRNLLAGDNILLNNFISDPEYLAIQQQQAGLSKALELSAAG